MNGEEKIFNIDNPLIEIGYIYGILKDNSGSVSVSNRAFEQRIYNYLVSKLQNNIEKWFINSK